MDDVCDKGSDDQGAIHLKKIARKAEGQLDPTMSF